MAVIAPIVSTFDNAGIRQAGRAFDRFSRTTSNALSSIGTAAKRAAIAVTGIGIAAAAGATKAISAASDLEESISATEQIFGDAADAVLAFSRTAAESIGQSQQTVLDGAAIFGTFGKAAGLAGDDLSSFTTDFVSLASDIASFRNAEPQEVIEAIGAGLRGESEPLRRFGVLLNDATLKAEALALGIYDGNGALTDSQKILAAEAAIYKQTADAQGDFARTSEGLANSQRILRARLDNVVAGLGRKFLPLALTASRFLLDRVVPAVEGLANAFQEGGLSGALDYVKPRIVSFVQTAGAKILELGRALVDWIGPRIGPAIEALLGWLQALGGWIIETGLPWLVDKAQTLGAALVDWIGPRIGPALEKLGEWLTALGRWIIDDALPWIADKAVALGAALVDWIGPRIVPALEALGRWLRDIGNWILDTGLPALVDKLISLGNALVDWIGPLIVPTLKKLGEWLVAIADWLLFTALPKLVEQAAKLAGALIGWVVDIAPDVIRGLGAFLGEIVSWIKDDAVPLLLEQAKKLGNAVKDGILNGLAAAGEGALNLGRTVVNGIIRLINSQLIDRLNRAFEFTIPLPFVDDIRVNPPDIPGIPQLADGGIVTGPTLALIGEAGPEAVVPLNKGGFGGNTYVTVNGAVDPVSTARQIRDILRNDERRLGRLSAV